MKWPDTRIRFIYKTGTCWLTGKSEVSRRESFSKMKDVLDMGLHMCIYPEEQEIQQVSLKSFHDGAFRLACLQKNRSSCSNFQ